MVYIPLSLCTNGGTQLQRIPSPGIYTVLSQLKILYTYYNLSFYTINSEMHI